MGCCTSQLTDSEYQSYWVGNSRQFMSMGFIAGDVKLLLKHFKIIERKRVNATGDIPIVDVLVYLFGKKGQPNMFWLRCMQIFDFGERHPDEVLIGARLNYRQFVYAIWNLASLSHKNLVKFAVEVYHTDKNPDIPVSTLKSMITELYGELKFTKNEDEDDAKYMYVRSS